MQLGFVIDQSRCIGCHACTVACKSENDVPLGSFRTWVKYTEEGEFPELKRSFAVLRCNQCSNAPCVTICPVGALKKRARDGIVDINPDTCIGCKSCLQGCPYDALYLRPETGIVEKCHFCAHRTEIGLAPACAVVCPTEAIIPGDFDDPDSPVSILSERFDLTVRKPEAGTGPNVRYRDATPAAINPLDTNSAGGYLWSDRASHPRVELDVAEFEALEHKARARTSYNVSHPALWGGKITGYLFTKSIAAGVFAAAGFVGLSPLGAIPVANRAAALFVPLFALVFLTLTSALLVFDLKRPERFFYILTRPNWSSWLVRGTYFLLAYGALLVVSCGVVVLGLDVPSLARDALYVSTLVAGGLSAAYTGWLFGQAKGRVLWMRRGLWAHLLVQAVLAGSAVLVLASPLLGVGSDVSEALAALLAKWLGLHGVFVLLEGRLAPRGRRREYERAHDLAARGPFAARHWRSGVLLGIAVPLVLLALPGLGLLAPLAAVLALFGLYVEEDVLVRAGQALPIS